ncbi:diiron oxygenase [Krasilnikovia sp. M28-CT-15]|uniref:diiron oxygenase n=1 Tax=Krasilnikovia sp. M28-CT-15 TaxID=3373540 RepID=UPI003876BA6F
MTHPIAAPTRPADARLGELVQHLCAESAREHQPAPGPWPAAATLDRHQWFTSPELVSLYATARWPELSDAQRRALSFWEAVNFYSQNIHGERLLIDGLRARLDSPATAFLAPYLARMIEEEERHSAYFTQFCERYAGRIYPERMLTLAQDPPEAADFLFFARVMIFEDIVDCLNIRMAADERLVAVARWINHDHHREERRHLAFGRRVVLRLFTDGLREWPQPLLDEIRAALAGYVHAVWRTFYNPQAYADAGLDEPWRLAADAFADPAAEAHRAAVSRRCLRFLHKHGVLVGGAA